MKRSLIRKTGLLLTIAVLFTSLFPVCLEAFDGQTSEHIVFVSADGAQDGDGTKEKPFPTIEAARDYLRTKDLDADNRGKVYLMEGTYFVNSESPTVLLEEEDSYVTYTAFNEADVKICGIVTLSNENFHKLSEVEGDQYASAVRLPNEVADKVYVYDLGAESIPVGTIYKNGFNWSKQPFSPELLVDSEVQTLAKYPNSGVMEDDTILAGKAKKTSDENEDTLIAREIFTAEQMVLADITQDGEINAQDSLAILKKLCGIPL